MPNLTSTECEMKLLKRNEGLGPRAPGSSALKPERKDLLMNLPLKTTVNFKGIAREVGYEYDKGRYLKIRYCKPPVYNDDWDKLAEAVDAAHFKGQEAFWRQLYEGEKQAGLLDPNPPDHSDPADWPKR